MKPIDSNELSGYLDGELTAERAQEVAEALATDRALRAEFDTLREADASWRAAAHSSIFVPTVHISREGVFEKFGLGSVSVLAILIVIRALPKMSDAFVSGLLLHGIALAIILFWVARMMRDTSFTTKTSTDAA